MEKSIGGILGLVTGAVIGNVFGGPVVVVVVAGLGGLLGYYLGSLFKPAAGERR